MYMLCGAGNPRLAGRLPGGHAHYLRKKELALV